MADLAVVPRVLDSISPRSVKAYLWGTPQERHGLTEEQLPGPLSTLLLDGSVATPDLLCRLRESLDADTRILCVYGKEEIGPVCCVCADDRLAWGDDGELVGRPIDGVQVRLDGPDSDGIGELLVNTPAAPSGIIGDSREVERGTYRTGDLARLADGESSLRVVLAGRRKDVIVRSGNPIFPGLIEPRMLALRDEEGNPVFRQCALLGAPCPSTGDVLMVFSCVLANQGSSIDDRLGARIADVCGPAAAPDMCIVFEERTLGVHRGELDRQTLVDAVCDRWYGPEH